MTIQTDSFTEIIEALDFVPEIPCESGYCEGIGRDAHPADWFVVWSCGCSSAICDDRRTKLSDDVLRGGCICSYCDLDITYPISVVPIGGSK